MFHECYDKNGNYIGRTTSEEGAKNLILQANRLIDQKKEAERLKREILLQQEAKRERKQQKKADRIKRRKARNAKISNLIKSYYKHFLAILATITALVLLILPHALHGDIYGPNTTYFDKVKRVFYWVTPEFKIPTHATEIDGAAFYRCDHLTSITIPNGVTVIENYAFYDCDNLTNITIPNSVIEIGEAAFHGCSNLKIIMIGNGVTKIGDGAFFRCSNLEKIYCSPIIPPMGGNKIFSLYWNYHCKEDVDCKIYVPIASVEEYKKYWTSHTPKIEPCIFKTKKK